MPEDTARPEDALWKQLSPFMDHAARLVQYFERAPDAPTSIAISPEKARSLAGRFKEKYGIAYLIIEKEETMYLIS